MSKLDQAIRDALSAEDADFLERVSAEQPLHTQLLDTFRGRYWWLNAFAFVLTFAIFLASVFCAWRFFNAPDLREMMIWGAGGGLGMLSVAMLKIWFWMELHKNTILREVKRLELQVARLATPL